MPIIDIHFHGTKRMDIREVRSYEEILLIVEEYCKEGIDGLLLTLYPDEIDKMRDTLSKIKKASENQIENIKIYGAYLEGPFINPKKCGALDPRYFRLPDIDYLKRLIDGYEDIVKIVTIAPELPKALSLIEKAKEEGIVVSMGHSDATFKEAQEGAKAGAKLITHIFNAMRGIHHRELGISGFGLINQDVYIEVIGDGRHLEDELLKWIFKVKASDKIILVSDMVKNHGKEKYLKGGNMGLIQMRDRLLNLGIEKDKIKMAVGQNCINLLRFN